METLPRICMVYLQEYLGGCSNEEEVSGIPGRPTTDLLLSQVSKLTLSQVYIALLKFDIFFFVSFSVQFLVMVEGTSTLEFILTIVALVITFPILFFAGFAAKRESVTAMCCTIFLYFAAMAYFLFKLVRMYDASYE